NVEQDRRRGGRAVLPGRRSERAPVSRRAEKPDQQRIAPQDHAMARLAAAAPLGSRARPAGGAMAFIRSCGILAVYGVAGMRMVAQAIVGLGVNAVLTAILTTDGTDKTDREKCGGEGLASPAPPFFCLSVLSVPSVVKN